MVAGRTGVSLDQALQSMFVLYAILGVVSLGIWIAVAACGRSIAYF